MCVARLTRNVIIASVIAFLLTGVYAVQAHAFLVRSDPAPEVVLDKPPSEISLWFNEPIDPTLSRVDLIDQNGQHFDNLPITAIDTAKQLRTTLPNIPDGGYTVVWQVTSALDGHLSGDEFVFYVGPQHEQIGYVSPIKPSTPSLELTQVVQRWSLLLTSTLIIGGVGFWLFVWIPVIPSDMVAAGTRRWFKHLLRIAWIYLGWVLIWSLVTRLNSVGASQIRNVIDSYFGRLILAGLFLWVGIGFTLSIALGIQQRLWAWWATFLLSLGMLLVIALNSHSVSAPMPDMAIAADWVHLLGVTLWGGGLVYLLVVWLTFRVPDPVQFRMFRGALVSTFSNMSRSAMVAILITGLYAAHVQLGQLNALFTTRYGHWLLIKLTLILPLLGIAGFNFAFTSRRIRGAASSPRWQSVFKFLVSIEVFLTVLILAVVGVFSEMPPGRSVIAATQAHEETANLGNAQYTSSQIQAFLYATLDIAPAYAGIPNKFTIYVYNRATGQTVNDAQTINLRFIKRDGSGLSDLQLASSGDGQYSAVGDNLTDPAHWILHSVLIRNTNATEPGPTFEVDVLPAPAISAVEPGAQPAFDQKVLLFGLGTISICVGALLTLMSGRSSILWIVTFAVLGLLFVGFGLSLN